MSVEIREESLEAIAEHAAVPIAFEVVSELVVGALGAPRDAPLRERACAVPYVKDYDVLAGSHPTSWSSRFDVSEWLLLSAWRAASRVGGAVIARSTRGLPPSDGQPELAVLWDLRVAPSQRRRGIASALVRAAERAALRGGCSRIEVETQNVNVPACTLYARCGFELRAIRPGAYAELPDEVQLIWSKPLRSDA